MADGGDTEDIAAVRARLDEALRAVEAAKAETAEVRAAQQQSAGAPAGSPAGDGLVSAGRAPSASVGSTGPGGVSHGGGTGVPGLPLGGTIVRTPVPRLPSNCTADAFLSWRRRFRVYADNHDLLHTIAGSAEVPVVSCQDGESDSPGYSQRGTCRCEVFARAEAIALASGFACLDVC